MCGICGWIDERPIDRCLLDEMVGALQHRGPDDWSVEIIDFNVGLGHARLRIIDLSSDGIQPMYNEDHSIALVYNGEFYSYKDFRENLLRSGHYFSSKTDSEVLIHLYEDDGPDFINKLRGMFAFGLWDATKRRLMLGRDRIGIKPLYYYCDSKTFVFASELKALLKHPSISRAIDFDAVSYYFMLGYIPREHCVFKDIYKLPPSHYLLFEDGKISQHRYWTPLQYENSSILSEEEYTHRLMELLNESVKLRMISDVPLGVFLSGGIDSSIIATLMASHSSQPVKTFSIGFDEKKYNELPYARRIAENIDSEHYEFTVGIDHTKAVNEIAQIFDEPFADDSAIPTYYVSQIAKRHVTVVLSGDGGDELFGGYNWYDWVRWQNGFNILPEYIRHIISSIASVPDNSFKGQHFLKAMKLDESETFLERTGVFFGEELQKLIPDCFSHDISRHYKETFNHCHESTLGRMLITDFHHYLPDDILTKIDRTSMAVSLEARVPLLDHKICEFAFSLPERLRIKCSTKKYLLKKIAERLLPKNFHLERKQGFSIPLAEWINGTLGDRLKEVLADGRSSEIFSKRFVEHLLREHRTGKRQHAKKLYAVLMFVLWEQTYLK